MKGRIHYLVYRITNNSNGMIYVGIHATKDVNDRYMGSGTNIISAIANEGISNFRKDILYDFEDCQSMIDKEIEIVDESFVKRSDTYNIILGGKLFYTGGLIPVKDKAGHAFLIHRDDPAYVSGKVKHIRTNKVTCVNTNGEHVSVYKDDPLYLSGELIPESRGKVMVKDENGNVFKVSKTDVRYTSGELKHIYHNTIIVKDKEGRKMHVNKDDPRYLSGELVGITKNTKISSAHRDKLRGKVPVIDGMGNKFYVSVDDPRYVSGELHHHMFGKFMAKDKNGKIYVIAKNDPRFLSGELVGIRSKKW